MMRGNDVKAQRPGTVDGRRWAKGQQIVGAEREALTKDLTKRYRDGASIRTLAESIGRSYGFVHRALTDAGVSLRARGGARRRRKARNTHGTDPTHDDATVAGASAEPTPGAPFPGGG
jgi:helix-turn-helix protein